MIIRKDFADPLGQTTLYFYVHLDDGQQMRPDHQEHLGSVSYIYVHRRLSACTRGR